MGSGSSLALGFFKNNRWQLAEIATYGWIVMHIIRSGSGIGRFYDLLFCYGGLILSCVIITSG